MKSYTRRALALMLLLCLSLVIFGCGGGSGTTVQTTNYKVEYIPGAKPVAVGKTTFNLKVTDLRTGNPAPGKSIMLMPIMDMGTMRHSTPVDSVVDNGDGTYTCNIYYLMSGSGWTLGVTVAGEAATSSFPLTVAASSYTTAKVTLKGINDKILPMTGTTPVSRTYQLFNDGLNSGTLNLFIAAQDDSMLMKFPAVFTNSTLHDQNGAAWTVNPIVVEASSTNGTTWVTAVDGGNGHWSVPGLTGAAFTGTVKVRVTVNGEQKTTDGLALSGTNDSASIAFTSGI